MLLDDIQCSWNMLRGYTSRLTIMRKKLMQGGEVGRSTDVEFPLVKVGDL